MLHHPTNMNDHPFPPYPMYVMENGHENKQKMEGHAGLANGAHGPPPMIAHPYAMIGQGPPPNHIMNQDGAILQAGTHIMPGYMRMNGMSINEEQERMFHHMVDPYNPWNHMNTFGQPAFMFNSNQDEANSNKSNSVEKEDKSDKKNLGLGKIVEDTKKENNGNAKPSTSPVGKNGASKDTTAINSKKPQPNVYPSYFNGPANPNFVPVFMLPPHQYASHPGAFNAAVAALSGAGE